MSDVIRLIRSLFDPAYAAKNGSFTLNLLILAYLLIDSYALMSLFSTHERTAVTQIENITKLIGSAFLFIGVVYVYISLRKTSDEEPTARVLRFVPAMVIWQVLGSILGVFVFLLFPKEIWGQVLSKSDSLNVMSTIFGGFFLIVVTRRGLKGLIK